MIQPSLRGGFGTCAASLQLGCLPANIQSGIEEVELNTVGAKCLAFGLGVGEVHLVDAPGAHEFEVHRASELDKPSLHERANQFASWHLARYLAGLPVAR